MKFPVDIKKYSVAFGGFFVAMGLYYTVSELWAVLNCSSPQTAYFMHTISELGIPVNETNDFSPAYGVMNTALVVCGLSFFLCNILTLSVFGTNGSASAQNFFISYSLAFFTAVGTAIVGIFHADSPYPAGLYVHYFGASCSFICGNSLVIFTCKTFRSENLGRFCNIGKILGTFGLFFGLATLACELSPLKPFSGIAERLTVYPLVIWEIVIGFSVFSKRNKT